MKSKTLEFLEENVHKFVLLKQLLKQEREI